MARWATIAVLLTGILAGCADTPTPEPKATRPVFCYRTLADVGCYAEPDPGRERRLTAIYEMEGDPWWMAFMVEPAAGPAEAGGDTVDTEAAPLPLFPAAP